MERSMDMQPPTLERPLSDKHRQKLRRMARTYSESFARRVLQMAVALDNGDDGKSVGVEYVDSLNGIDVYEDVVDESAKERASEAGPRLRSFCHIEGEIRDVARRLSTSVASSELLPGIIDSHEICSVLEGDAASSLEELEFPEHVGINWFVLNQESERDSTTVRSSSLDGEAEMNSSDASVNFEFIVLSYQGLFKHRGRRGWVQWCQSIELPSFPAQDTAEKKRGVVYSSGIVAVESSTRPGQVSVAYSMGVDLRRCDGPSQRKFLESAVWKRVMKLAALKKSLLRDSLTRTLSISSTDMTEEDDSRGDDEPVASSRSFAKLQLEKERWIRKMVPEKEKVTVTRSSETPRRTLDRVAARLRAQSMEPLPQHHRHEKSLFKEPNTLEFRLSLYRDPEDEPSCDQLDELAKSQAGGWMLPRDSRLAMSSSGRQTTVRSVTGWV